jgi:hypothetical protein
MYAVTASVLVLGSAAPSVSTISANSVASSDVWKSEGSAEGGICCVYEIPTMSAHGHSNCVNRRTERSAKRVTESGALSHARVKSKRDIGDLVFADGALAGVAGFCTGAGGGFGVGVGGGGASFCFAS